MSNENTYFKEGDKAISHETTTGIQKGKIYIITKVNNKNDGTQNIYFIDDDLCSRYRYGNDYELFKKGKKTKEKPTKKHLILKKSCNNFEKIVNNEQEAINYLENKTNSDEYDVYLMKKVMTCKNQTKLVIKNILRIKKNKKK